jgi:phage terminase Nu1 subunit (DNA packaging protein)
MEEVGDEDNEDDIKKLITTINKIRFAKQKVLKKKGTKEPTKEIETYTYVNEIKAKEESISSILKSVENLKKNEYHLLLVSNIDYEQILKCMVSIERQKLRYLKANKTT